MGPLSVSISIRNDYRALEGPEEQMAKYEEFLLGVGAARNREMNYVEKLVLHLVAVSAQECLTSTGCVHRVSVDACNIVYAATKITKLFNYPMVTSRVYSTLTKVSVPKTGH